MFLEATSVSGESPGRTFPDLKAIFSDQNNNDLPIAYSYVSGPDNGEGLGAFITGNGNKFSVFVKTTSFIGESEAEMAQALSGAMTPDGIENLQIVVLMLDNHGNSGWIENNTGRMLIDKDGFQRESNNRI